MVMSSWLRYSPAGGRVQRERQESVPERIVDGDFQLAGQPEQAVVVGQLAVTGSGAHNDDGWSPSVVFEPRQKRRRRASAGTGVTGRRR